MIYQIKLRSLEITKQDINSYEHIIEFLNITDKIHRIHKSHKLRKEEAFVGKQRSEAESLITAFKPIVEVSQVLLP